ncbi:MAG TPA: response regulator [Candidatus Thermoplasmatota archaeon]|nr:response regulator [Candidatus Thermoplasmatota archaeon]
MPSFLVVDDSPTIRMVVVAALKAAHEGTNIQVAEAATETEALDRFMGGSYDMVFLDMMLTKDKSALDLVRAVLTAKPDAKIVVTTGLDRENPEVIEAISLGAFAYLRKPVRAADVRSVIEDAAAEAGRVGRIR